MNPVVQKISQQNSLSAGGQIVPSIVISYTVGSHGPFTLVTTQADISSGKAKQQMQAFATSLATLPMPAAS